MSYTTSVSNESRVTVKDLIAILELADPNQQIRFTIEFDSDNPDCEQVNRFKQAFLEDRLTRFGFSCNLMR